MREQIIKSMAKSMRLKALEMALNAGSNGAHLGSAFSAIEILACLYGEVMKLPGKEVSEGEHDIFIPGKAHCVLAFYTALAYSGFFPVEDLDYFEKDGLELPGHPVMNVRRGIEFSGGSLGMALSQGAGMALGAKMKGSPRRVFVLLGDGECNEGSVWEAAMSASHFRLDNLIAIVDKNKLQYDGDTEDIMKLNDLGAKFTSFGFDVYSADGHDIPLLRKAFNEITVQKNAKPKILIADTIKGKGISFMENKKEWHHSILNKDQYDIAVNELRVKL